jgi:hypothetical protein
MKILLSRWAALAVAIGLLGVLSSGCVVGGGYDGGAGYGLDYYEPYGVGYGGWGPDYQVAPYRDGDHRPVSGGGHAFRAAPASRSMPSIPSGSRSGGGGGGRGGRGGGGARR